MKYPFELSAGFVVFCALRLRASVVVRQRVTAATQVPPHRRAANSEAQLNKMLESHKRERLGTYMYMAPEVYRRQKYDEKVRLTMLRAR